MGVARPLGVNFSSDYNSLYNITLDTAGWDKTVIQVVAPMVGTAYLYGTLDAGAVQGVTDGNAELAINFSPIQATNLATGSAVNTITAAGTYKVENNNQFLRLQGNPAGAGSSIYKLLFYYTKVS